MDIAISLNSAMTFTWGFVHCDPHPGNILVRRHPDPKRGRKGEPQIVLIDHGLYIPLREQFREEYCTLWRSLFVLDVGKIEEIARKWGIAVDANMWVSTPRQRAVQAVRDKQLDGRIVGIELTCQVCIGHPAAPIPRQQTAERARRDERI
jgi:aarF domain-containing kinase